MDGANMEPAFMILAGAKSGGTPITPTTSSTPTSNLFISAAADNEYTLANQAKGNQVDLATAL